MRHRESRQIRQRLQTERRPVCGDVLERAAIDEARLDEAGAVEWRELFQTAEPVFTLAPA